MYASEFNLFAKYIYLCLGALISMVLEKEKRWKSYLARDIKGNKTFFSRYFSNKRKTRKIVGSLLKEMGDLVTWDTEKAEVLNDLFASCFTSKNSRLNIAQAPEGKGWAWRMKNHPL